MEPWASESRGRNEALVGARQVVLEKDTSNTDQFGRLLRYVWMNDPYDDRGWVLINRELVRLGFADAKHYPPDLHYQDTLDAAEDEARAADLGIWADPTPVP